MATPLDSQQTGGYLPPPGAPKRLIVCCDGTWMDSLGAEGGDPPSNVTRISRTFCRTCSDGTHQIINYFPGVGTAGALDRFTGGAFGMGLDRDIREVYNFICTNYVDGDDIVLVGFSRGAFTARSTADMIASVGLLTPEGLDHFYTIFEDYENMGDKSYRPSQFLIPGLPEYNGSHGQAKIEWERLRMEKYKLGLRDLKYTRDTYHDGVTEIRIKALAVWDTVGTLGIPPAPVIGVRGSADQWRFTNTQVSDKVEYAFQALSLDDPRYAFRPSLWERLPGSTTKLKQVWFPGNHGNVGGGWYEQQMSDITLAWMCDQLSTLGVEFNFTRLTATFHETLRFSAAHPFPYAPGTNKPSSLLPAIPKLDSLKRSLTKLVRPSKRTSSTPTTPTTATTASNLTSTNPPAWSLPPVYHAPPPQTTPPTRDLEECTLRATGACTAHHFSPSTTPAQLFAAGARPWGLGTIRAPTSALTTLGGKTVRRPGRVLRVDETTNEDTAEPLVGTNERVHSSVRVRGACGGLGLDDNSVWACEALKGSGWRVERGVALGVAEEEAVRLAKERGPREIRLGPEYLVDQLYPVGAEDHRWRWVFEGKVEGEGQARVPQALALPEEPLVGYWERYLLGLTVGGVDVWKYAQGVKA